MVQDTSRKAETIPHLTLPPPSTFLIHTVNTVESPANFRVYNGESLALCLVLRSRNVGLSAMGVQVFPCQRGRHLSAQPDVWDDALAHQTPKCLCQDCYLCRRRP